MLTQFVAVTILLVIGLVLLMAHIWFMVLEKLTRGRGWKVRSAWTFFMTFVYNFLIGYLAGMFVEAFLFTVHGALLGGLMIRSMPVLCWIYSLSWWYVMPERITEGEYREFLLELAAKGQKPLIG